MLRAREPVVGLALRCGCSRPLWAAPRRHLSAHQRGPVAQLYRVAVLDDPGRGRPDRTLRLPDSPLWAAARPARLLDGALPSDRQLLRSCLASVRSAALPAVPAMARSGEGAGAVFVAGTIGSPLRSLRLGHLRPRAAGGRATRQGGDRQGRRGCGDGHRYEGRVPPQTSTAHYLTTGAVAGVAGRCAPASPPEAQSQCPVDAGTYRPAPLAPAAVPREPHWPQPAPRPLRSPPWPTAPAPRR